MSYMRRPSSLLVTAASLLLVSRLPAQTIVKPVRWDTPLPAAAVIAARADSAVTKMLAVFPAFERAQIQKQFDAFARTPKGIGAEHVRAASYMAAGYDNLALLFAADAVRRDPMNGLSVGNYGALIYSKDGPAAAVETLRFADSIAPNTVSVMTTLGNVALTSHALERARVFFQKVLRIDGDAGEALLGMGKYFMEKQDPKSAFPYFVKASGFTYDRKAETAPPPTDSKGKQIVPPEPVEAPAPPSSGGGSDDGGGSAHVTGMDIDLAPSPDWSSPDAFVAASEHRKHYAQWYISKRDAAMAQVMAAAKRISTPKNHVINSVPGAPRTEQLSTDRPRSLNEAWLMGHFDKALDDFSDAIKPAMNRLGNSQQFTPPAPLSGDIPAAAQQFREQVRKSCQDAHALLTGEWMAIKPAQAQLFDDVNALLKKYYKAQGGWIRKIEDPDEYAAAVASRDAIVASTYAALLMNEDGLRMAVALGIAAGGTESSTKCPGDVVIPEPPPSADSKTPELAGPPQVPCPFRDNPIDLSGKLESIVDISAEFKLDCNGVTYGGGAGPFNSSRTRIFHTKTIINYKVEVEKSVSQMGASASVRAMGNVQITRFDTGKQTITTSVELEGKVAVKGVAEASITGGLSSNQ